jgi:hypothetical protein
MKLSQEYELYAVHKDGSKTGPYSAAGTPLWVTRWGSVRNELFPGKSQEEKKWTAQHWTDNLKAFWGASTSLPASFIKCRICHYKNKNVVLVPGSHKGGTYTEPQALLTKWSASRSGRFITEQIVLCTNLIEGRKGPIADLDLDAKRIRKSEKNLSSLQLFKWLHLYREAGSKNKLVMYNLLRCCLVSY